MSTESLRCAVIGVGQTKHEAKRIDVSQVGLVREAALRALEDAGMTWDDIDAAIAASRSCGQE